MSSELQHFLISNHQALQEIVSKTILSEAPVWEQNLQRHINAPFPNLLGHMTLQRLINLQAPLLIAEAKYVEAEQMLEASWKINEYFLKRREEITFIVGQKILRLQLGNLRQVPVDNAVWHERLTNPEIGTQLWKVLEGTIRRRRMDLN